MVYSYLKPNALYINLKFNLKPSANGHNVVGPQPLALLVVTFCLLLHALLHIVACHRSVAQQCWIRLHCSSSIFGATQMHHTWSAKSYGLYPSHDALHVPTFFVSIPLQKLLQNFGIVKPCLIVPAKNI